MLAACAGTVQSVTEDPLLGTTVVLDHDDGYQTTYANLADEPDVAAGEEVNRPGRSSARWAAPRRRRSDTPHLHFAVSRDGKAVNPGEFLES